MKRLKVRQNLDLVAKSNKERVKANMFIGSLNRSNGYFEELLMGVR